MSNVAWFLNHISKIINIYTWSIPRVFLYSINHKQNAS